MSRLADRSVGVKRVVRSLLILCAVLSTRMSFGRPPNEAEFTAASGLGHQIGTWVGTLPLKEKTIAIFSITAADPFEPDYATMVEAHILSRLNQIGFQHASSCSECRSPQLNIEGENLIIRKGTPDTETMRKIGERQEVEAFLTVDILRSNLFVLAQANVYKAMTGELIGTEKFSEAAVSFNNSDVMCLITLGAGRPVGVTDTSYDWAGNIALVEELGFGKGGLSLGGVLSQNGGTLVYVNPTLVFNGRIGASGLSYAFTGGAGFGLLGSGKGIDVRGSAEFFLGSWTVLGAEYIFFSGDSSVTGGLTGYYGIHIGISFGR